MHVDKLLLVVGERIAELVQRAQYLELEHDVVALTLSHARLDVDEALTQQRLLLLGEHADDVGRVKGVADRRLDGELHAIDVVDKTQIALLELAQRLVELAELVESLLLGVGILLR